MKLSVRRLGIGLASAFAVVLALACTARTTPRQADADQVTAKVDDVVEQIGGPGRFGGMMMNGFAVGMPAHMGFGGQESLATSGSMMQVALDNRLGVSCTFDVAYMASYMGLNTQHMQVDVPAGQQRVVDVPCAEIMGLGQIDDPDAVAARCADGVDVRNMMAVPGFMGADYACGGAYGFMMDTDRNDLDQDGDRNERMVMSQSVDSYRQRMGMGSMMGGGMMGGGMMRGAGMMGETGMTGQTGMTGGSMMGAGMMGGTGMMGDSGMMGQSGMTGCTGVTGGGMMHGDMTGMMMDCGPTGDRGMTGGDSGPAGDTGASGHEGHHGG